MGRAFAVQLLLLLQLFCSRTLSQSDGSAAPMEEKEKEALFSMIRGFVGEGWNGSELYPDPCGWTSIQGVSCDLFENGKWYITAVSIGPIFDNSLECKEDATFSPELLELRYLRSLTIYNCFSHQTTTIPSKDWNRLSSSLHTLEFRSNRGLAGKIPPVFGQLVNLQSLVLTDNSLSGELPLELGNLVHLKRLTLSSNRFYGKVPASLGANLGELLIMDISSNSLTGPLPPSLGSLSSLLKLDLSNNLLSGILPQELSKLKSLTLLDLRNNNISGGLTPALQGMASLQDMLLCNNPVGGSMSKIDWTALKNLTHLDLSNANLIGEIPDSIAELKEMRFLALSGNMLSGSVSPELAAMPNLCALYLHGNNLSGELKFSEEFYSRMGTRFASWDNPNLCYRFAAAEKVAAVGLGPEGVSECAHAEDSSLAGGKKTSGCSDCVTTSNSSSSSTSSTGISVLFFLILHGIDILFPLVHHANEVFVL